MLYLLIKTTIISLILIFLVHYLYDFFKTNLTIPKIKDLVNRPTDKYNDIIDTIQQNTSVNKPDLSNKLNKSNDIDSQSMKDELKSYLKQQMNNKEPVSFSSVAGNTIGSNPFSPSSENNLGNYTAY